MPRLATVALVLTAITATAAADVSYVVVDPAAHGAAPTVHTFREPPAVVTPNGTYFAIAGTLGGSTLPDHDGGDFEDLHLGIGAAVDLGVRLSDTTPVFAHGQVGLGSSGKVGWVDGDNPSGVYFTARAGIELRGCGAWACLLGGVDAGLASFEYVSVTALQLVPRAGFELGSGATRFRSTIEAPRGLDADAPAGVTTTFGFTTVR